MHFIRLILILGIFLPNFIHGQILQDSLGRFWIKKVLDNMYNFEFEESKKAIQEIEKKYPEHPVNELLKAMVMERAYYPFESHPEKFEEYKKLLEKGSKKSTNLKDRNEKLFFNLSTEGYLASICADQNNYIAAIGHAKNAYNSIIISRELIQEEKEFLYTTGLYNYLREAYSEVHPIVKPFLLIFKSGNKELGIRELELGYQRSVFTGIEAGFNLCYLYKKYENKPEKALKISRELHNRYPQNPPFLMQYTEVKILANQLAGIDTLFDKMRNMNNPYVDAARWTFAGILEERKGRDEKAFEYFEKAIKLPFEEKFTREYRGMAYLGLAKIYEKRGDFKNLAKYLTLAKEYCEYKRNILEINELK